MVAFAIRMGKKTIQRTRRNAVRKSEPSGSKVEHTPDEASSNDELEVPSLSNDDRSSFTAKEDNNSSRISRKSSSSSNSNNSSSSSSSNNSSNYSSANSGSEDDPTPKRQRIDMVDIHLKRADREVVCSSVHTEEQGTQVEVPVNPTTEVETQTSYTTYPRFLDNNGEIVRKLKHLQVAMNSFQQRMAQGSLRSHTEARGEIARLHEKVLEFLKFHRHQITSYIVELVLEGHKAGMKNHLRTKSNEAIMPILGVLDTFKRENLRLGSQDRAPLGAYRPLLERLEDAKASLGLLRFIDAEIYLQ